MNVIEKTKHDGSVEALGNRIRNLQHQMTCNWDGIKDRDRFCRLGAAINNAAVIIQQMRETLEALQELEPNNK